MSAPVLDQTEIILSDFVTAGSPHLFILGATGSGKTEMLNKLARTALDRGDIVHLIDAASGGHGFRSVNIRARSISADLPTAARSLEVIAREVRRRTSLLSMNHTASIAELPPERRPAGVTVAIEGFLPLIVTEHLPPPSAGAVTDERWHRVAASNDHRNAAIKAISEIMRTGVSAGVSVLLTAQRLPSGRELSLAGASAIIAHSGRLLLGPSSNVERMRSFRNIDDAINVGKGWGVLERLGEQPQRVRVRDVETE